MQSNLWDRYCILLTKPYDTSFQRMAFNYNKLLLCAKSKNAVLQSLQSYNFIRTLWYLVCKFYLRLSLVFQSYFNKWRKSFVCLARTEVLWHNYFVRMTWLLSLNVQFLCVFLENTFILFSYYNKNTLLDFLHFLNFFLVNQCLFRDL